MSRAEIVEMQELLNRSGFDSGAPDGIGGRKTRTALRAYQRQVGQPADGYPTPDIIVALRRQAGGLSQ